MLEHVVKTLGELFEAVVVAGPARELKRDLVKRISFVQDEQSNRGPLSGVQAILGSGVASAYIVVACDQPSLNVAVLKKLLDAHTEMMCFEIGGELYPLPGYYSASLLSKVTENLSLGKRSLKNLHATACGASIVATPEDAMVLQSVNTPDEYAEMLVRASQL